MSKDKQWASEKYIGLMMENYKQGYAKAWQIHPIPVTESYLLNDMPVSDEHLIAEEHLLKEEHLKYTQTENRESRLRGCTCRRTSSGRRKSTSD